MNTLAAIDLSAIGSENITIAIVGYIIVFAALVSLFFVFFNLPRLINLEIRSRLKRKGKKVVAEQGIESVPGEVNAAIATALYLYISEMHDEESNVVTIKKVSKIYSPWSSKIYGINRIDKKNW